jgi:hypothetical protein
MKFEYCKELSFPGCGVSPSFPYTYHFQFSLSYDEIQKVLHKYERNQQYMNDVFEYSSTLGPFQMLESLRIIQDALDDKNVDLGTNYKEKYDEIVELLKPHKLEDDMSPATTLKIILKYHK